jgi:DNA-binding response OmpR family regulator
MSDREMCPHCGYNFERDDVIVDGVWLLEPTRAKYRSQSVGISPQEAGALYTIAKGAGDVVRYEAILNRITSSEAMNHAYVVISRLKRKLPVQPFEIIRGHGVRWTGSN